MKKSILVNILTLASMMLVAYSGSVSESLAVWFGSISAVITLVLTTYFPSGTWIGSEWKLSQWGVSLGQITLSALSYFSPGMGIPVELINFIGVTATLAIQYFGKFYK